MEIRSGKAIKSQKILYSAMLLIHFGFLISGIKATVKEIENKRLLVFTLQCLPIKDTVREIENVEKEIGSIILINAVFFLYFMIMIKWAIMALIAENVAYSLNEKGISLIYKGKIKRTYRWERMKTKRIVYKGRGFMGQKIAAGWEDRNECAVFCIRKIKDSIWQSPFPPEAWSEKISLCSSLVSGIPFIIWIWRIVFQGFSEVMIFLSDKVEVNAKGIYYMDVNKKYFMEKMAEWHVELEDNKPEEIPPWKEQL